MERNIVFTDEIITAAVLLPEIAPFFRVAGHGRPLLGSGQITDDRIEPDINAFVFEPFYRYRHAPSYIARDGPVFQPFLEVMGGKINHILPPVELVFNPTQQLFVECAQLQEEMLSIFKYRGRSAQTAVRFNQFIRVERFAAGITLVAAGSLALTKRTGSLNIAVRQETFAFRAVCLQNSIGIKITLF